jgi:hypothetical protein
MRPETASAHKTGGKRELARLELSSELRRSDTGLNTSKKAGYQQCQDGIGKRMRGDQKAKTTRNG